MGFDVFGLKAVSEKGKYFRNNVWYWRPLWEYVCQVCDDVLTERDFQEGMMNSGHQIDAKKCQRIYDRLTDLLKSGEVRKYKQSRDKTLKDLEDEDCDFCKGVGIRNDKHVQGTCNACSGKGKVRPFSTSYPFEEENVREFCAFLKDCGGFEIC